MDQLGTLDPHRLMQEAVSIASHYLNEGVRRIDRKMGAGYARLHPELLGSFMQAAAVGYAGRLLAGRLVRGEEEPAIPFPETGEGLTEAIPESRQ